MTTPAFLWTGVCFWLAAALTQLAPGLVGSLNDLPLIAPAAVFTGLGAGLLAARPHRPAEELLSTMLRLVLLLALLAAINRLLTVLPSGHVLGSTENLLLPGLFALIAIAFVPPGRELARSLKGLERRAALKTLGLAAAVNAIVFALLRPVDAPLLRLAPALIFLVLCGVKIKLPRRGLALTAILALFCLALCSAAGWRMTWSDHVLRSEPMSSAAARSLLPAEQKPSPGRERPEAWTAVVIDDSTFDFSVDLDPIRMKMATARNPAETAVLAGMAEFYRLPFRLRPPGRTLIINSGLGNTLAAGEREGWQALEALEPDPALLQIGRGHPERPYQTPGLIIHRRPALSLLGGKPGPYDLIAIGPVLAGRQFLRVSGQVRAEPLFTREALKTIAAGLSADGVVAVMVSAPRRHLERRLYQMLAEQFGGAAAWSWTNTAWNEEWTLVAAGPGIQRYRPRPGPGLVNRTEELRQGRPFEPATRDWPYPFFARAEFPRFLAVVTLAMLAAAAGLLTAGGALRNLQPPSTFAGAFLALVLMRTASLPVPTPAVWAAVAVIFLLAALFGRRATLARRAGSILAGFGLAAPLSLTLVWVGMVGATVAGVAMAVLAVATVRWKLDGA